MNDLISRQAAIDEISKQQTYKMFEGEDTVYIDANDVGSVLVSLPSAQPRKGKWIGYKADDKDWQRDDGSPIFMNCSECHEAVINNGSAHWNFCPNCGADMRGEQDE